MKQIILSFVICLTLAAVGCAQNIPPDNSSQESQSPQPNYSYYVPRTVNKDGWEIPGLDKTEVEEARQLSESLSVGSTKAYHTRLRPKEQIIIDFSTYFSSDYPTPKSSMKKLEVSRIYQYDVNGYVYCYLFSLHRLGLGSTHGLAYFDEDGDGKFEVIMEDDLVKLLAPDIPQKMLEKMQK